MIKSTITVYKLPVDLRTGNNETSWFIDRQEAFTYQSELDSEIAVKDTFHLTFQQHNSALTDTKHPLISSGDIVKIETYPRNNQGMPEYFLCKSNSWEKYKSSTIQLIRHLLW